MKLNRTTLRTVEILKLVSKKPDGITLDEICAKLDMPKTSAYDIVTTLVQTGMIHVAREQKQRYTIGLTAYRIGINYTNRDGVLSRISFKKHTDRTICTREEFERELKSVREKGYAFDARELEEHMECVGAPVFGQDGNVMGAISVSSLYKPTEDYDALGRLVSDKGAQLSRLLGYIGHV